jgi:hypothetical protein
VEIWQNFGIQISKFVFKTKKKMKKKIEILGEGRGGRVP